MCPLKKIQGFNKQLNEQAYVDDDDHHHNHEYEAKTATMSFDFSGRREHYLILIGFHCTPWAHPHSDDPYHKSVVDGWLFTIVDIHFVWLYLWSDLNGPIMQELTRRRLQTRACIAGARTFLMLFNVIFWVRMSQYFII